MFFKKQLKNCQRRVDTVHTCKSRKLLHFLKSSTIHRIRISYFLLTWGDFQHFFSPWYNENQKIDTDKSNKSNGCYLSMWLKLILIAN